MILSHNGNKDAISLFPVDFLSSLDTPLPQPPSPYYAIFPPLSSKPSCKRSTHYPLFFTPSSNNFSFQFKILRCLQLNLLENSLPNPSQILSSNLLHQNSSNITSSITSSQITSFQSLPSEFLNPLPCLSDLPISHHNTINGIFNKEIEMETPYTNYIEGQKYEYGIKYQKDLPKALEEYLKGAENNELGCLFKLTRIYVEPELAEMFNQTVDHIKAFNYFLQIFASHGLFDYFSSTNPSIQPYALFNIYLDIFPNFKALIQEICDSNIENSPYWNENISLKEDKQALKYLLTILLQEDFYSEKSLTALQELSQLTEENHSLACFLYSDLLETTFYGTSAIHDLHKRIKLYSATESSEYPTATTRLINLLETLALFTQMKNLNADHIHQNIKFYCEKLQDSPTIEVLRKTLNTIFTKQSPSEQGIKELYLTLYYLGDDATTKDLFYLLQYLKDPFLSQLVSHEIQKTKNSEYLDLINACCIEKGFTIGGPKKLEALKIYQKIYKKLKPEPNNELNRMILYRTGATLKHTVEKNHADFFFRFHIVEILLQLQRNPTDIFLLYQLYKMIHKGRGIKKKPKQASDILKIILEYLKPTTPHQHITMFFAKRASTKLQNSTQATENSSELKKSSPAKPPIPSNSNPNPKTALIKLLDELENDIITEIVSYGVLKREKLQDRRFIKNLIQTKLTENIRNLTQTMTTTELPHHPPRVLNESPSSPTLSSRDVDLDSYRKVSRLRTEHSHERPSSAVPKRFSILRGQSPGPGDGPGNQTQFSRIQQQQQEFGSFLQQRRGTDSQIVSNTTMSFMKGQFLRENASPKLDRVDTKTREKIQNLLETERQVSYKTLTQQIYLPESRKPLLNFLKTGFEIYKNNSNILNLHEGDDVDEKSRDQKVNTVLLEFLENLTKDNKLRLFKESDFTLTENKRTKQKTAITTQNHQLFDVIIFEYPVYHLIELLLNSPLLLLTPLTFHNPQFFSIYAVNFNINPDSNNIQILYFLEPKIMTLKQHLHSKLSPVSIKDRIAYLQQILRILQAFHIHNIPLLNFSYDTLGISLDNQVKLLEPFLPILGSPHHIDCSPICQQRMFIGPVEKLPIDIFREHGKMTPKSDIFCFGLIMFEALSGLTLLTSEDFQNETEYLSRLKNGLLQQRVIQASRKNALMLPNPKLFPTFLEDTILPCLTFHKKDRPSLENLMLTLQQIFSTITENEQKDNKSTLEPSEIREKISEKWNIESPYTMYSFIKQQYQVLQFTKIPPDHTPRELLLPSSSTYKGLLKDLLPSGEGELTVGDIFNYHGNFYEGLPNGAGTAKILRRKETITGRFWHGYPVEGRIENPILHDRVWFEEASWIPTKDYRTRMVNKFGNLDPRFIRNLRLRTYEHMDDFKNNQFIKNLVDFWASNEVIGTTRAQLVDCFGNFYYFPVGVAPQIAPSSLIVKKISSIELSMRVYRAKLSTEMVFGVDLSALDIIPLREKGRDALKGCYQGNFEQIVRYSHFGWKYSGRVEANKLQRGVVHLNFDDYFWYDVFDGIYQGGHYMQEFKSLYIGDLCKNQAEGYGVEYIGSQRRYEGEYKLRKPHGRGIVYNQGGKLEFRGILYEGWPVYGLYYEENRVYEGRFKEVTILQEEYETLRNENSTLIQEDLDEFRSSMHSGSLRIEPEPPLLMNMNEILSPKMESCRNKPEFMLVSSRKLNHKETEEFEGELGGEKIEVRKTEFKGTVHTFSPNIKILRGQFILEDKRFTGKFYILYSDGSEYEGELKNGIREGYGVYKRPSGAIFTGIWKAGTLKGKIEWNKSSSRVMTSEGEFLKEKTGKTKQNGFGRLKFRQGGYYIGEIKNSLMDGYGKLWDTNRGLYEGSFKTGKKYGIGKLWKDLGRKGDYFEGEFSNGIIEGFGVIYQEGIAVFKGKFVAGIPVIGKIASENYLGNVKEGIIPEGWGRIQKEEDNLIVEGVFIKGKLEDNVGILNQKYFGEVNNFKEEGLGMKEYDTTEEEKIKRYEGEWREGKRRGEGKIYYADETLYRGEIDKEKEGVGEYKLESDVTYRGEFKDGKRNGRGMLNKKGKNILGLYEKGKIEKMVYNNPG